MTIKLSEDTQSLMEKVLASGRFESAEHFLQYSLGRTLTEEDILEDEDFIKRMKASLARAEEDIKKGRVYNVPYGELADFIAKRNEYRVKSDD